MYMYTVSVTVFAYYKRWPHSKRSLGDFLFQASLNLNPMKVLNTYCLMKVLMP